MSECDLPALLRCAFRQILASCKQPGQDVAVARTCRIERTPEDEDPPAAKYIRN
jgi:hypothetical protein